MIGSVVSGHHDCKMTARYTQIKAKDLHRAPPKIAPTHEAAN